MKDNEEIDQFDDYELFEKALSEEEDTTEDKSEFTVRKKVKRNEGKSLVFDIESGSTLLDYLFETIKNQSRTTVRSYLKNRQVSINGIITTQFDKRIISGDVVEVSLSMARNAFNHSMLDIIYEDDYLLLVNKKNGLLTMATDRERKRTAYYILSEYLKKQDINNRIFIVHRLDRETSGLLLFAKNVEVQHTLQQNWADIVLERKYVAVVCGSPSESEGEIRTYLKENKALVVYSTFDPNEGGDLAVTRYRVLNSSRSKALVELELLTGRKNQIRVHMKDLGCPILGDKKYGGEPTDMNRVALHANKIRFIHPVTEEEMSFDTNIPSRFNKFFFFK